MGHSKLLSEIHGLSNCLSQSVSGGEEYEQVDERHLPQYTNMISAPNIFNASHKISINQGVNLGATRSKDLVHEM